ncbi:unnamed protein product [Leuciscus chuanchicus]
MDDETPDCAEGFQRAMDVFYSKERIESLLAFVKEKRSEGAFQAVYAKAADLTSDPRDEPMRKCRLTQLQDPQERYRNLYMAILDNILEQISQRFSNLESMLFLEIVNPGKFDDVRQVFPEEAFQSVLKSYGHPFDSGRLRSELQVQYSDRDLQGNRGKLCDYLVFLKDMELDSAMPQLYKLFSVVATIGATSAGVERSFSCLKQLKSYTCNTMGQGRLSSLALLAVDRTMVKSLEKTPSWYDREDTVDQDQNEEPVSPELLRLRVRKTHLAGSGPKGKSELVPVWFGYPLSESDHHRLSSVHIMTSSTCEAYI